MILVAFVLLGIQAIASLIRIGGFLTGRETEVYDSDGETPMRIE